MTLQRFFRHIALIFFACYLAVFPGSTITVSLDRVPEWGLWMGSALLIAQGAAVMAWLIGWHGRRGFLAGGLIGALGWGVEKLGISTGFPFGEYSYTDVLQPQIFGVPLAICCAWVMVVPAAYQIAQLARSRGLIRRVLPATATIVLLLDLQIETVAAHVNGYWVWLGGGAYYAVPTTNFVAWWAVGFLMGLVLEMTLRSPATGFAGPPQPSATGGRWPAVDLVERYIPVLLLGLSVVMFTAINLSFGYLFAGLIGLGMLAAASSALIVARGAPATAATNAQSLDRSRADHA